MTRLISLIILAIVIAISGFLFYQVMANYFVPMFVAVVLVIVFRPVHEWFLRHCRGHDHLAAGLTMVAILMIVLTPLGLIAWKAAKDALRLLPATETAATAKPVEGQPLETPAKGSATTTTNAENPPPTDKWQLVRDLVKLANEKLGLELDADEVIRSLMPSLQQFAVKTPSVIGNIVFGVLVLVFCLYYFLVDGQEMIGGMIRLFPLNAGYQLTLLEEFQQVSRALVTATLASAVCQGILGGIGYLIFGLPSVFLLMLLTMLMSMIPLVGSMSVWGGSAAYLYFTGHPTAALLMALYGACIISMADNIVKPLVLQGQSKLHPLWGLLSGLGGLAALGPIGVFVGPLVVAFLQAGLKLFRQELTSLELRAKVAAEGGGGPAPQTGRPTLGT